MQALSLTHRREWIAMCSWWQRPRLPGKRLLLAALALVALYGLWPYGMLWSLNRALIQNDRETLALLVDLDAIRDELTRRLNKEQVSAIETLSDEFIAWLATGIRQHGVTALEARVTLDWVCEQLTARSATGHGLPPMLSYGCFEGPFRFRVRLGQRHANPLAMRLRLSATGWRVATLYY